MRVELANTLTPFQRAVILLLEQIAKDIKDIADVGRE
jgi:hypothetical protein